MSTLFRANLPIILASASPRRRDFLNSLGLTFETIPALAPEPRNEEGEEPCAFTMRSAAMKAREVFERLNKPLAGPGLIIGADTVVVLQNELMGKPKNEAEALAMLRDLAGRAHLVYSGCCCLFYEPGDAKASREHLFYGKSQVRMRAFSDTVLAAYVSTGEPADKAGAYAIQGRGAFLVEEVQGSWSNIVGLPLDKLVELLLENGAISPCGGND